MFGPELLLGDAATKQNLRGRNAAPFDSAAAGCSSSAPTRSGGRILARIIVAARKTLC